MTRIDIIRAAMFKKAERVTIYDVEYLLAPLPLGAMGRFDALMAKYANTSTEDISVVETLPEWLDLIQISVNRVDPEVTRDELELILDTRTFDTLVTALMKACRVIDDPKPVQSAEPTTTVLQTSPSSEQNAQAADTSLVSEKQIVVEAAPEELIGTTQSPIA